MSERDTPSPSQSLTDFMTKKIAKAKDAGNKCEKCGVLFLDEDFDASSHTCWFNPPFKRDNCGVSLREFGGQKQMSERDKAIEEAQTWLSKRAWVSAESVADFAICYHAKQNAETEKWIPVSERLPDDIHERCFWTLKRPHNRGYRVVIKSVAETEWSGVEAVAWMPLPAPYLEQAEGGEE